MNFNTTRTDVDLIRKIVDRAFEHSPTAAAAHRMSLEMDLSACHLNGCPLDLARLLAATIGNFSHDVQGINVHINRNTGALEDCFLPRYALPD